MSKKHFSLLLVITVVIALLVLLVPSRTAKQERATVQLLLPELSTQVNDAVRVQVIGAGEESIATLQRADEKWVVEEAGQYPADWGRLKTLLAALAQAEIVESKTSNPAYFSRLGVEDVSSAESESVLIRITPSETPDANADGSVMGVIVGVAASDREGQYVRLEGADRALLIDQSLDVARDREDWLERTIIDVADTEVVEISIRHPDGEMVTARRVSADDTDFTLVEQPEAREILSAWTINSLGGALSGLQLEGVQPEAAIDWTDAVTLNLLTADGLRVQAGLVEQDEKHWMRLQAETHDSTPVAVPESPEPDSVSADADSPNDPPVDETTADSAEAAALAEQAQVATASRVDSINDRVAGWAYEIPEYKFGVLTKRLEDLLKPLENS